MPATAAERKRKQRQKDREDPDRKFRKLDSIYMFNDVDVSVIIDNDGTIWFKGVDIARALEMEAPNDSIAHTIDKKYCKTYEDLVWNIIHYRDIPNMQPKTTFVNEYGMNLFVLRSRKPKAEPFTEWVVSDVLPSIRRTNKYEMEPSDNPYKELNDYLKKQLDELKMENMEVRTDLRKYVGQLDELQKKNMELQTDMSKYVGQLFEMKPSCVPKLENEAKQEFFVVYRKYKTCTDPTILLPYYACRVQLDSLEQRQKELLKEYPDMEKLLQLLVPNSVNFFNFILEQMPDFIERGSRSQSFRIKNIDEAQMLTMVKNLYRTQHGAPIKEVNEE